MIDIIVYYILPPVALALSVLFYLSARNNAKRTEEVLKQINNATQTWQNDIMKFASDLLNSTPSVVGQKEYLQRLRLLKICLHKLINLFLLYAMIH